MCQMWWWSKWKWSKLESTKNTHTHTHAKTWLFCLFACSMLIKNEMKILVFAAEFSWVLVISNSIFVGKINEMSCLEFDFWKFLFLPSFRLGVSEKICVCVCVGFIRQQNSFSFLSWLLWELNFTFATEKRLTLFIIEFVDYCYYCLFQLPWVSVCVCVKICLFVCWTEQETCRMWIQLCFYKWKNEKNVN